MAIKPSMLLHSCCGPCSTAVIEKLKDRYDITVFYYNPNIAGEEEYQRRKAAQKDFLAAYSADEAIAFIEGDYDPENFLKITADYEKEPEGGARCALCFEMRLAATAAYAKVNNYAFFTTTLSVSPHKNADLINDIGLNISSSYDMPFLVSDFKKENGYRRSVEMAKSYHLYRQNYCGCIYSMPK